MDLPDLRVDIIIIFFGYNIVFSGYARVIVRVIVREIMSFIQIRKFDECAGIFLFCPPAVPSRAMVFDLDGCQSLDTVELYP
jgi:hypothetical protein